MQGKKHRKIQKAVNRASMERSKKQLVPKSGDEIQLLDPQTLNSTGLSP